MENFVTNIFVSLFYSQYFNIVLVTFVSEFCKTLVMTEYPRISHAEYFRDKFSIPTEDMMRTRFRASPYVVKGTCLSYVS